jgi:hypothetical protein
LHLDAVRVLTESEVMFAYQFADALAILIVVGCILGLMWYRTRHPKLSDDTDSSN